jgi:hypothetical protein
MASTVTNRKSELERHIWSILERDNVFHKMVKPNNRIKMYLSKDGNPVKSRLTPADLPQVMLKPPASTSSGWNDDEQTVFASYDVNAYNLMNHWLDRNFDIEIEVKGDGGLETDEVSRIEAAIENAIFRSGPKLGLDYVRRVTEMKITSTDDDVNDGNERVRRRVSTIRFTVETRELMSRSA